VNGVNKADEFVLVRRVKEYEQAHNSHDAERVIALFTDDVQFETVGEWAMTGKKRIRDLEEWDAALNDDLAFTDLTVSGDTVTCKAVERSDLLKLAGFKEVKYDSVVVEFRGDLIRKITVRTVEEDRLVTSDTFHSMVDWARRERYGDIAKLVSDGKFAYNARNASGWMVLMREWLKTKGEPKRQL
jgi:ketosteroid isomerase-like protein